MTDLPKIGKPAIRALAVVGVTQLEHLAEWSESELLALHGVGPKAIVLLRPAMDADGAAFGKDQPADDKARAAP